MSIKVTREQVAAARIVRALDQAEGRESDEWIERLTRAKEPARDGTRQPGRRAPGRKHVNRPTLKDTC